MFAVVFTACESVVFVNVSSEIVCPFSVSGNTRLLETDDFRWLERCLELQAASKPPNQLFFFHGWEGPMLKLIAPPAGSVGGHGP